MAKTSGRSVGPTGWGVWGFRLVLTGGAQITGKNAQATEILRWETAFMKRLRSV